MNPNIIKKLERQITELIFSMDALMAEDADLEKLDKLADIINGLTMARDNLQPTATTNIIQEEVQNFEWEYKVEVINVLPDKALRDDSHAEIQGELQNILVARGKKGWELVQCNYLGRCYTGNNEEIEREVQERVAAFQERVAALELVRDVREMWQQATGGAQYRIILKRPKGTSLPIEETKTRQLEL